MTQSVGYASPKNNSTHLSNMERHHIAEYGKTFIRKADGADMGEELWLGEFDTIDNYEEKEVE